MPGLRRSAAPSTAIRSPSRSNEKTLRNLDSNEDLLTVRLPRSLQQCEGDSMTTTTLTTTTSIPFLSYPHLTKLASRQLLRAHFVCFFLYSVSPDPKINKNEHIIQDTNHSTNPQCCDDITIWPHDWHQRRHSDRRNTVHKHLKTDI